MDIILPVETKVRELEGKLWTALSFLENGHTVLMGKTPSIHESLDFFDADVVFIHGASRLLEEYDQLGVGMAYLDTEGGVFSSQSAYKKRITKKDQHKYSDTFFAWGEKQAAIADEVGYNNVIVSGNPRFDLLDDELSSIYDGRATKIKNRFGKFILMNTNFSRGNHAHNDPLSQSDYTDNPSNISDWHQNLCLDFISVASHLTERIPQINIVIRPHPSENFSTYQKFFNANERVHVIHSGNVRPWIKASEAVVHNSCTTGIESALLSNWTFSYMPYENPFGSSLPNTVSRVCETEEDLLQSVKVSVRENKYDIPSSAMETLKRYFHNVDEFAAPIMAEKIHNINNTYTGGFSPSMYEKIKRLFLRIAGDKAATRLRSTELKDHWKTSNQKFSYISTEAFKQYMSRFDKIASTENIDVERVSQLENTFLLSR